jgi:hypothetical protein
VVSAERDKLMRLVRNLPEVEMSGVLAVAWPPAFFASAPGDGESIADEADELLHEGFGR